MEHQFKVGDRIRVSKNSTYSGNPPIGTKGTVEKEDGSYWRIKWDNPPRTGIFSMKPYEIEPLEEEGSANHHSQFLLRFDTGFSITEFFSTLPEVRARIQELAASTDLNRDSLRLYHISKVEKVELSTVITFKAIDQKPAPRKRAKKA